MTFTTEDLARMTAEVREVNTALGWRAEDKTFGDFTALLHSEVSEMLKDYRVHRLADATKPAEPIYRDEEVPKIRTSDVYTTGRVLVGHRPAKPEGVGSEAADVLIRLLDQADVSGHVLDPSCPRFDVLSPIWRAARTFGDYCAFLHHCIDDANVQYYAIESARGTARGLEIVLEALTAVCEKYGIDLAAEYTRKIAYNRTRPFQHGGTVTDAVTA
jgi:hypothetical protein